MISRLFQFFQAAGVKCYREDDECNPGEQKCTNGRCVHYLYLCDGIDDCRDGSDEDPVHCKVKQLIIG